MDDFVFIIDGRRVSVDVYDRSKYWSLFPVSNGRRWRATVALNGKTYSEHQSTQEGAVSKLAARLLDSAIGLTSIRIEFDI